MVGTWGVADGVRVSGGAQHAAAPSGVVTFLFTDIEGSTRRWEADPDAMRAALESHDAVLRAAIEAHGGWLFKHTGDGVCAVFASPGAAVDAAVAAALEDLDGVADRLDAAIKSAADPLRTIGTP
jgi:class 3 adenylate cyclase